MDTLTKTVSKRLEYYRVKSTRKFTEEDEHKLTSGLVRNFEYIAKIDFETAAAITDMIQGTELLKEPAKAMLSNIIDSKVVHSAAQIKRQIIATPPSARDRNAYRHSNADDNMLQLRERNIEAVARDMDAISSAEADIVAQHTTHRAIEICGMFCPDCCLDEERPGRCINAQGHRDNHYCGKCGNADKRSNGNIWKGTLLEQQFVTAFDQAPFYRNDACSKTYKIKYRRGSVRVPLIENRSCTRERFTVVTGPSGSYKEHDLLTMQDQRTLRAIVI